MKAAFFLPLAACALLASGCSDDEKSKAQGSDDAGTQPEAGPPVRERPAGPAADVSEELTAGGAPFIGAASASTLPASYVEHEFVAAGTATAYAASGALTNDGKWTITPGETAEYRTRILVRRPADGAKASGTVLVEWLNVSGGIDANPDYASAEEEILREGHTWVGVSAQLIGIEGGPVLVKAPGAEDIVGKGLKVIDAARYASLAHPGDGFSFDIFTQVARALLAGGPVLGGAKPSVVLALGESQSAFALTSYYDGVQPLTEMFDGFFVHSRGGASLPFVGAGKSADLAGSLASSTKPVFRDDLDAPVLELQAESDVTGLLGSFDARQPDSETFRLWEVAGTAHADAHLLGPTADLLDCGVPVNHGPLHLVAKAALHALDGWVRTGTLPATGPRLDVSAAKEVARDADGIAQGGIRTPPVDVPLDVHSGVAGPSTEIICLLLGSSKPLAATRLAEIYRSPSDYETRFDAAVEKVLGEGFVLEADRAALEAYKDPSRL